MVIREEALELLAVVFSAAPARAAVLGDASIAAGPGGRSRLFDFRRREHHCGL